MATKLTDAAIKELSLVFRDFKGTEWGPRNEEALVLGTKATPVDTEAQHKAWATNLIEKVKSWVLGTEAEKEYDAIAKAIVKATVDLNGAIGSEHAEKASASVIDSFLAELDAIRNTGKAGKRHSAADQGHLDAINAAADKAAKVHDKLGKALAAVKEHADALQPAQADDAEPDADDADKAGKYGSQDDAGYADEKNKKYPLKNGGKDDEERIRAAWSYINQEKNAAEYSPEELSAVKDKIRAAMKRIGADVANDKAAPATSTEDVEMNKEEVAALVVESVKAALAERDEKHTKELNDAKAEAEKAVADAATAKADAEKAQADAATAAKAKEDAEKAQADAEKIVNDDARKPSGKSGSDEMKFKGADSLARAVKAANSGSIISAQGRE
jgi:hypothetical protein